MPVSILISLLSAPRLFYVKYKIMKREVIIVNDFYKDPDAIAKYARSLKFYSPYHGSSDPQDLAKAFWVSSLFKKAKDCPLKSSSQLIKTLEEVTGEEVDLEHWNKDFPENPDGSVITPRPDLINSDLPPRWDNFNSSCRWNLGFNVKYLLAPDGTGVHNHVTDQWNSVGENGWAGIVYLNKNASRDTGLRTWINKFGAPLEWMTDKERWEMLDCFANVYNRLILVRGWMPHSGGSGFGDSVQNGRLFQTLFFKTKEPKNIQSCDIKFL